MARGAPGFDRSFSVFPCATANAGRGTTRSSSLYNAEWRTLVGNRPLPNTHSLVTIAGPTGCGKTELSLRVAGAFSGEVVNCDSVQIYRFFNIGSAKLPV